MMGRQNAPEKLFYQFRLEDYVPFDHPLRQLDAVLKFDRARTVLAGHYSCKGRPSIDPELMLRMLLVGYAYGIRSERQLCNEVHLNLAYRWFCRLGLEGAVPDHSTFSKNRHGRFRESDVYRVLFEEVVEQCRQAGGAKYLSPTDPAAAWNIKEGRGRFGYFNNYLVDTDHPIIVDVEATPHGLHKRSKPLKPCWIGSRKSRA